MIICQLIGALHANCPWFAGRPAGSTCVDASYVRLVPRTRVTPDSLYGQPCIAKFTGNEMPLCMAQTADAGPACGRLDMHMRTVHATAFALVSVLCLSGATANRGLLQATASAPAPDFIVSSAASESAPTGSQAPATAAVAMAPTVSQAEGPLTALAFPQSAPASVLLPAPSEAPTAVRADVAPAPANLPTASMAADLSQPVSGRLLCLSMHANWKLEPKAKLLTC